MSTRPRSGRTTPASAFSSVLLPAPFEPTTVTSSPSASVRLRPRKRPHLVDGAGVEGDDDVSRLDHRAAPAATASGRGITSDRKRGTASATTTISEVTSRMSDGPSPMKSAAAMTPR